MFTKSEDNSTQIAWNTASKEDNNNNNNNNNNKKTAHILDIMKFMCSEKLHGCVYQEDAFTLNGINMSD